MPHRPGIIFWCLEYSKVIIFLISLWHWATLALEARLWLETWLRCKTWAMGTSCWVIKALFYTNQTYFREYSLPGYSDCLYQKYRNYWCLEYCFAEIAVAAAGNLLTSGALLVRLLGILMVGWLTYRKMQRLYFMIWDKYLLKSLFCGGAGLLLTPRTSNRLLEFCTGWLGCASNILSLAFLGGCLRPATGAGACVGAGISSNSNPVLFEDVAATVGCVDPLASIPKISSTSPDFCCVSSSSSSLLDSCFFFLDFLDFLAFLAGFSSLSDDSESLLLSSYFRLCFFLLDFDLLLS